MKVSLEMIPVLGNLTDKLKFFKKVYPFAEFKFQVSDHEIYVQYNFDKGNVDNEHSVWTDLVAMIEELKESYDDILFSEKDEWFSLKENDKQEIVTI